MVDCLGIKKYTVLLVSFKSRISQNNKKKNVYSKNKD